MAELSTTIVYGDLTATGDITGEKVFNAVYNDIAELFECENKNNFKPGDVLIMTKGNLNYTNKEGDKRVVGVYSDTYGYLLGGENRRNLNDYGDYIPIGLSGRVNVKVIGPIKEGDLLETSNIKGYAQASLGDIPGTVFAKALESAKKGERKRVSALIMNR